MNDFETSASDWKIFRMYLAKYVYNDLFLFLDVRIYSTQVLGRGIKLNENLTNYVKINKGFQKSN